MKSKPVTLTFGGETKSMFNELEIVISNNHPMWGEKKTFHITYKVQLEEDGSERISFRKLNVSSWPIIRKIELRVLRKLLKNK